MKAAVRKFVRSCSVCLQSKYDRSKSPGLLHPLPVPDSAWQVISLDFIEGLPLSQSYNCILLVVDLLTKYGRFIPLRHPFTIAMVAKSFFHTVYSLHGLPTSIVSDRDRIFTSHFWTELFTLANVKLCHSTAYLPQSDGQTERLNQCLETYALFMRVQANGITGYPMPNSGIIHALIQLLDDLRSRHCMDIRPVCLLWILLLHLNRKCSLGLLGDSGWISCFSTTSIVPSTA